MIETTVRTAALTGSGAGSSAAVDTMQGRERAATGGRVYADVTVLSGKTSPGITPSVYGVVGGKDYLLGSFAAITAPGQYSLAVSEMPRAVRLKWPALAGAAADTGATTLGVTAPSTYTRATGSFVTDGLQQGDTLTASGFADPANNGAKVVASVSALSLVVTDAALVTEVGSGDERLTSGPDANLAATCVRGA